MTTVGGTGRPLRKSDAALGMPVTAMKWPNTVAPATMVMIMAVMSSVSLTESQNFRRSSDLLSTPITMAPPCRLPQPGWG